MRYLMTALVTVALAGCGGQSSPATTTPATAAAPAAAPEASAPPAAAGPTVAVGFTGKFQEGAEGCRDKAKSKEAWEATAKGNDAVAFRIWGDGMADNSCRAFGTSLGATATSVDPDGWICATPSDDAKGACYWVAPGKVG